MKIQVFILLLGLLTDFLNQIFLVLNSTDQNHTGMIKAEINEEFEPTYDFHSEEQDNMRSLLGFPHEGEEIKVRM